MKVRLLKFSTGTSAAKLKISTRQIFNWRDRYGMWPVEDAGKHFRADIFDLAEAQVMVKLMPHFQRRAELALPIARFAARGVGAYALQSFSAWEEFPENEGWEAILTKILSERFPDSSTGGMRIDTRDEARRILGPARAMIFWEDGFADLIAHNHTFGSYLGTVEHDRALSVASILDLDALGNDLRRRFGKLAIIED